MEAQKDLKVLVNLVRKLSFSKFLVYQTSEMELPSVGSLFEGQ